MTPNEKLKVLGYWTYSVRYIKISNRVHRYKMHTIYDSKLTRTYITKSTRQYALDDAYNIIYDTITSYFKLYGIIPK